MIWDATALNGYAINASDGQLGTVSDLMFDDKSWAVKWLIVDTGDWLPGRKVRLPVSAFGRPDAETHSFPVKMTKLEVIESADAATTWPEAGNPNLHGVASLIGCHVHATDGEIGHIENLLLDESSWGIRYLTVHTANWLPAHTVLISPRSVREINWEQGHVHVGATCQKIKESPRYDHGMTVDGAFDEKFLTYYGIRWVEGGEASIAPSEPPTSPASSATI